MNIFSTIELDGKIFYLTDEQARYMLKESVYQGKTSKFVKYYDPYTDIEGNQFTRFVHDEESDSYTEDPTGEYLYNEDADEYYNPLDTTRRFKRNNMYVKDVAGSYIFDSTSGTFVNPYSGVTRYHSEGEFTWEEDSEGEYLYDPLCENKNNGFYKPYFDKYDVTIALTRYVKNGSSYIEHPSGDYIKDEDSDTYYNPWYDKDNQSVALTRYTIGTNIIYVEDDEGSLIYNANAELYYNPYEGVDTYSPSDELSTFSADANGTYIETEPFDKDARPNFGFYNEFPEYKLDKEEFVLGTMDIFKTTAEERVDYVTEINLDQAELEVGSIDRVNGEPLKDTVKCRCDDFLQISGGQKYSITNDKEYWMQIFEYKFDTVINEYVFIKSYKVTYGLLFTTHNMTTHIRVATGEANTTDIQHVKIKLVTDAEASGYVFNGPTYETYDEAYKAGFYYFFDTTDRSQFCKLVGDGTNCQAYERYQISTKILKQVSEINDATNSALSRITQTGAEITLEVQSTAKDLRSYIQQQMNVIRLEVIDNNNGLHTQIQMTADAITSLATSSYLIIDNKQLTDHEVTFSILNPGTFAFSDRYPILEDDHFVLDADRTIHNDYASAYKAGYVYFNCGETYLPSDTGTYILNGYYYNPYDEEINAGRHRYTKTPAIEGSAESYVIDDTTGAYILVGENYVNPYTGYTRYERLKTFCRLTYNFETGYGYDIYTTSDFSLRSLIEQTASRIRLEVSDTSGTILSRINISKDEIIASVEDLRSDTSTKLTQTADDISAVASLGGTTAINSSVSYAEGIEIFYRVRPKLSGSSFAFNTNYLRSFENFRDAYDAGYFYFSHDDEYVEYALGDYILVEGEYVNPYNGVTRYIYSEDMAATEDSARYTANVNGRYIKNSENRFVDPYEGKTRYIKLPTYCEIVKNNDIYSVNLLCSSGMSAQTKFELNANQLKIAVTDTSGAMSSLRQTASTIKLTVEEANAIMTSSIELNSDRISLNTQSMVVVAGELAQADIPTSISITANHWFITPPAYNISTKSIVWNTLRRKSFPAMANAIAEGYFYLDAGDTYIQSNTGLYLKSGNSYSQPYGTENEPITRYMKIHNYNTNEDEYEVNPIGTYILSQDGARYYDPFAGLTSSRYEKFASFYKFSKLLNGDYHAVKYIFVNSKLSSDINQTANEIKLTVDNEAAKLHSKISLTDKEIRSDVSDIQSGLQTSITQNADKIAISATSSLDKSIVSEVSSADPSAFADLYLISPPYNQETKKYYFGESTPAPQNDTATEDDHISKYKFDKSTGDVVDAFNAGYIFFPNNKVCYIENIFGDYICENGSYLNPYVGQTRYSRQFYDYNPSDEATGESYSYLEDTAGRYIKSGSEYIDPMWNYVLGRSKTRYISLSPDETYNRMDMIHRVIASYQCVVEEPTAEGDVIFSIAGKNYLVTTFALLIDLQMNYDINTKKVQIIASGSGALYQEIDLSSIAEYPGGLAPYTTYTFSPVYEDEYRWTTITNNALISSASITLANNEIAQTINDASGAQSQIRQTAEDITAIVKGAPTLIGELGGNIGETDYLRALTILAGITTFYATIPQFNELQNRFIFSEANSTTVVLGGFMTAYNKSFRYFEYGSYYFADDADGEFIKEEIIQAPIYRYFNPKEIASYGQWYSKYGEGDAAVYMPDDDGQYYLSEETYINPWYNARTGSNTDTHLNHTYNKVGEEYTVDDLAGLYIAEEIPQDAIYKYYIPYYEESGQLDENGQQLPNNQIVLNPVTRYTPVYRNVDDGTLIQENERYFNPYTGQYRYTKDYIRVSVTFANGVPTGLQNYTTGTPIVSTGEVAGVSDTALFIKRSVLIYRDSQYIHPYYCGEDRNILKPTYSKDIQSDPEVYKSDESDYYIYNYDTGLYENYIIGDDPLYIVAYIAAENGDYILNTNTGEYYNPYEGTARFALVYEEDIDGRYIYTASRGYYDPYYNANRFSKYPCYCKLFSTTEGLYIRYYGKLNDKVSSEIKQTAESITLRIKDETSNLNSGIDLLKGKITASVEDLDNKLSSRVDETESFIKMSVSDAKNDSKTKFDITASGVDSLAAGSLIIAGTGSSTPSASGLNKLYNQIPLYVPGTGFTDRGAYRFYIADDTITGSPDELSSSKVESNIADGYQYASGNRWVVTGNGMYSYDAVSGYVQRLRYKKSSRFVSTLVTKYKCSISTGSTGLLVIADDSATITEGQIRLSNVTNATELGITAGSYVTPLTAEGTTSELLTVVQYIEDSDGNYYFTEGNVLTEETNDEGLSVVTGTPVYNETWHSSVPGYYKITSATNSGGNVVFNWEFYIRAEQDYSSKISQKANEISLEVDAVDTKLQSAIKVTENSIMSRVDAKELGLQSQLNIQADSINSMVSGTYIGVDVGTTSNSTTLHNFYKSIPAWNGSSFSDVGPSMPPSQDAIYAGYVYSAALYDGVGMAIDASGTYINNNGVYINISTRYSRTETIDANTGLPGTPTYTESATGNYYKYYKIDSTYYQNTTWYSPSVPGYYKITSATNSGGNVVFNWEFYIRAEQDYSSKISQKANEISLEVSSIVSGGKVNASLVMAILNDESSITLKADKINFNGAVFFNQTVSAIDATTTVPAGTYSIRLQDGGICQYYTNTGGETTSKWYLDGTGKLFANNAEICGDITANTGYIGGESGWIIGTCSLYSGTVGMYSGNHYTGVSLISGNSAARFYVGPLSSTGSETLCNYLVLADGSFYAKNASISGHIIANSGYIGGESGWSITTSQIYSGTVGLYSGDSYKATSLISGDSDSAVRFYVGSLSESTPSDTVANSKVLVLADGSFYATNAHITGYIWATDGYFDGTVNARNGNIGNFSLTSDFLSFYDSSHRYSGMQSSDNLAVIDEAGNAFSLRFFAGATSITSSGQFNFAVLNDGTTIVKQLIGTQIQGNEISGSFKGTLNECSFDILAGGYTSKIYTNYVFAENFDSNAININKIRSKINVNNYINMNYTLPADQETRNYTITVTRNMRNTNHFYISLSETNGKSLFSTYTIIVKRKNIWGQESSTQYTFLSGQTPVSNIDVDTGDWWNVLRYWIDGESSVSTNANTSSTKSFSQSYSTSSASSIDIHANITPYWSAVTLKDEAYNTDGKLTSAAVDDRPNTGYSLGNQSYLWNSVWCDNIYFCGGIQFSDRSLKKDISYINDEYDQLYDDLEVASYKYIFGTSGRTHIGLIGNDMKESLDKNHISTTDFAPYVEFDELNESLTPNGNKISSIRYTELIPLNINQIQKLKKRLKTLEEHISEQDDMISQLQQQLTNNNNA